MLCHLIFFFVYMDVRILQLAYDTGHCLLGGSFALFFSQAFSYSSGLLCALVLGSYSLCSRLHNESFGFGSGGWNWCSTFNYWLVFFVWVMQGLLGHFFTNCGLSLLLIEAKCDTFCNPSRLLVWFSTWTFQLCHRPCWSMLAHHEDLRGDARVL